MYDTSIFKKSKKFYCVHGVNPLSANLRNGQKDSNNLSSTVDHFVGWRLKRPDYKIKKSCREPDFADSNHQFSPIFQILFFKQIRLSEA